mmetsp:Transcript_87511/g.280748  ORF Transcript_87511/g.280748 Transcript_87511/m.280748 type:complete len:257 (+) Transcript_87511:61-831(+)
MPKPPQCRQAFTTRRSERHDDSRRCYSPVHADDLVDFVGGGRETPKTLGPNDFLDRLLPFVQTPVADGPAKARERELLVRRVAQSTLLPSLAASAGHVELARHAIAAGMTRGTNARQRTWMTDKCWRRPGATPVRQERVGAAICVRKGILRGVRDRIGMRTCGHEAWRRHQVCRQVGRALGIPVLRIEGRLDISTSPVTEGWVDVPTCRRSAIMGHMANTHEGFAPGTHRARSSEHPHCRSCQGAVLASQLREDRA